MSQLEIYNLPITGEGGIIKTKNPPPHRKGDIAYLHCENGYTNDMDFTSTLVLKNGVLDWQPNAMHCIPISCVEHIIPHGKPSHRDFHFNVGFRYICDEGYEFSETENIFRCGSDGNWVPDPLNVSCNPIPCEPLNAPGNGSYQIQGGFYFGSVATFKCNTSFRMVKGQETRECLSNGKWSGEEVKCEQVVCPPLDARAKIVSSGSQTQVVDCGNGKTVTVDCLVTGQWSKPYPYCYDLPVFSSSSATRSSNQQTPLWAFVWLILLILSFIMLSWKMWKK